MGWDDVRDFSVGTLPNFNPPTPCGVGHGAGVAFQVVDNFNPPTPCGVGLQAEGMWSGCSDFNPPTPCGVGLRHISGNVKRKIFQSTHPVWGGTAGEFVGAGWIEFQSTHPVWGGTCWRPAGRRRFTISIHPPRVGWDSHFIVANAMTKNFNPPTPCGVGLKRNGQKINIAEFQSTHPVWGGTKPA